MSKTLLDIVQTILSSMDGDEVNSINDTVESRQVSEVVRTVYEDIVAQADLPEHGVLFTLTGSADASKPTLMYRPSTIHNIEWVKYNKALYGETDTDFRVVSFIPINEFMVRMHSIRPSGDPTGTIAFDHVVNGHTVQLLAFSKKAPDIFTTFDDDTLIFDSYDSQVDTTLQSSKTLCYGQGVQTFTMSDSFVPVLDDKQMLLLLHEAKSLAFAEMKQVTHAKAEQMARRQRINLQRSKRAIPAKYPAFYTLPNYGRK